MDPLKYPSLFALLAVSAPLLGQSPGVVAGATVSERGDTSQLVNPATPDSILALSRQVTELERRIAAIEKRPAPATTTAGPEGFSFRSGDGAFSLRVRGLLQSDGRFFGKAAAPPASTSFLLRRARPIVEGTLYRVVGFRIVPDFGQGTVVLFDANVDLRLTPAFDIRAGKFKAPIGLERLQSAGELLFAERGLPTNLVPQRDVGIQIDGDLRNNGVATYALGVFNGSPDLASGDVDNGSQKDVDARLFFQPFRASGPESLKGFGIGVGGSRGSQLAAGQMTGLPSYKTPAQQTMFGYRGGATPTLADGDRWRLAPQGYFYRGRFGLMGELTRSAQSVVSGTSRATLTHQAWQLATNVVLGGGNASFRAVTPAHALDPARHQWGAFEIGARVGQIRFDPASFPVYADRSTSVARATEVGAALNWYLGAAVRIGVNGEYTRFTGGAPGGASRSPERALLTRFQTAF